MPGSILADLFSRDRRDKNDLAYVASPLGRARSTMDFVREVLGLPAGDYASMIVFARSVTANGRGRRLPRCR